MFQDFARAPSDCDRRGSGCVCMQDGLMLECEHNCQPLLRHWSCTRLRRVFLTFTRIKPSETGRAARWTPPIPSVVGRLRRSKPQWAGVCWRQKPTTIDAPAHHGEPSGAALAEKHVQMSRSTSIAAWLPCANNQGGTQVPVRRRHLIS